MYKNYIFSLLLMFVATSVSGKTWTFEECLQYAFDHNITLQRAGLSHQSASETTLGSKAQLLPSLSFNTSQNVSYQPWKENGAATIQNNEIQMMSSKTSYNGSYNVGANWTVWNGNRNVNQVKLNALSEHGAELDSIMSARNIEEQIAQLFVQILYGKEAVKVNEATLEAAKVNEARAQELLRVGMLSKADCSQFTAQRAQDAYNVVMSENNVRDFKRQLKALLQITDEEDFDVMDPTVYENKAVVESMSMKAVPSLMSVYEAALQHRPELQRAALEAQAAEVQMKIAKGQRMPTVALNAAVSTNTSSLASNGWGNQLKTNVNAGGGVTVSIPILDQRSTRTAVNKANIQRQTALLDLKEKQTNLYSTIENYWIQATNYQSQYKAAKESANSALTSYELLSEQFAVGLKNIVELQEGKTRLLNAQLSELQSKYMTIFNIQMLEFYGR